MTRTLYLKPSNGKLIRDPATGQQLPPHGAGINASPFWHTALRVGDVEKTTAAAIGEAEETPEAAAADNPKSGSAASRKPKD